LKEGQSANTTRSYAAALRYWAAWFRLRYRATIALPVPVAVVLQFVVDHVERVGLTSRYGNLRTIAALHSVIKQALASCRNAAYQLENGDAFDIKEINRLLRLGVRRT
jgi:hypothetical protein